MKIVKAHAFGNDFLLLAREQDVPPGADRAALARELVRSAPRHRRRRADRLSYVSDGRARRRAMDLLNADGSYSEVSGNGVRCLAAWLAREPRHRGRASRSTSRPTPA